MGLLNAATYNKAEEAASHLLPNRIIECCQPAGFNSEGYPTRVFSNQALWRYVDVMHEGRLAGTFKDILGGGVTEEEIDLMREVSQKVSQFSEELYGRKVVPKDALARALNIYRHIKILYPNGKATILEIGSGSGYIGALLSLAGYTYLATDIAQSFYLFQNHLMNAITPGKCIELADDFKSLRDLGEVPAGWSLHIPWWKFVCPQPNFSLAVDLVTANHCLCEMHPRALSYTLKTAAGLLANRGSETCFLFEGWGSTARNPIWSVNKQFSELGLGIAHSDTLASVYVRSDGPLALAGVTYPRASVHQTSHKKVVKPGLLARLCKGSPVPQAETATEPSSEALWHPDIWVTPANPVSKKITEGREHIAQQTLYGIHDFEDMLCDVLGNSDTQSDDEKFLRYINAKL